MRILPFAMLWVAAACGNASGSSQSPTSEAHQANVPLKKVMIVIFENKDYDEVNQQPFFSWLASHGANVSHMYAERHPSQPDYIALISGSTYGISSDDNVDLDGRHIGDLLEETGKSWKVYAEGYPGNCFLGATSGKYARKHVPFFSFKNVTTNPSRCAKVVNASQLDADIASGHLPDFSLYIPDIDNDAHDKPIAFGDNWYHNKFGPLLNNPRFMDGMLLVTTFDEGSTHGDNRIYTSLYGNHVKPGAEHAANASHYDLLKTFQTGWGLGGLGHHDGEASPITDVWQ